MKIIPAKATEIIKNKRTGKTYKDKAEFDKDVADLTTDTVQSDLQQDLQVTVASLEVFGKTKEWTQKVEQSYRLQCWRST